MRMCRQMSRQHWAVWIACSSLQSLDPVPFDVFCYALTVTHDCAFHNQDDSHGILSGIDEPDDSHATASDDSDTAADRIYLCRDFSSSRPVYWLYGIL